MKFKKNLFAYSFILILLTISNYIHAQKDDNSSKEPLKYLTTQQKQLLKEQQDLLDKTKAIIRENLTKSQLVTLKDRTISKAERAKLLKQSLTAEQRNIITTNRDLIKIKRFAFRNSLTKKQRIRLRHFIRDRKIDDRRRLARRLRRLVRDNITDR